MSTSLVLLPYRQHGTSALHSLQIRRRLEPKLARGSLGRTSHDASRSGDLLRWGVKRRCDAGLGLGGGEVGTEEQSSNELVGFDSNELTRDARSAWRRARNSSCDALGGVTEVGKEGASLEVSALGVRSAERNELVSFASYELTRGVRWAWRCARNSSCDALGGAAVGTEEALSGAQSAGSNELMSFVSDELRRGTRWAWRRARNSSCDMKLAETSIGLCVGVSIASAEAKDLLRAGLDAMVTR